MGTGNGNNNNNNNNSNGWNGGYFLYLRESGITLSLPQVTAVLWNTVTDQNADPNCVTTVCTSLGDFFITERDTQTLSKALNGFNRRYLHKLEATNALYQICDGLFWLAGVGYPQPTGVATEHGHASESGQAENAATSEVNYTSNPNPISASSFSQASRINIGKSQVKSGITS